MSIAPGSRGRGKSSRRCSTTVELRGVRGYLEGAPGPEGHEPANPVRAPKAAAARGVLRRFVRPGVFARWCSALTSGHAARIVCTNAALKPAPPALVRGSFSPLPPMERNHDPDSPT